MPPRKGIVKTGNAGNSSKASALPPPQPAPTGEKALFPAGYKYPVSLLNERCQKEGWQKAIIHTPQRGADGFSFTVELARMIPKGPRKGERETVRFVPTGPRSQILLPTALEARHWGAVYALYRFSNNMSLNRVLPPAPRDYWNQLVEEHKEAQEHQKWMYNQDPFAAKREVEERQAKVARVQAERNDPAAHASGSRSGPVSNEFSQAPEVKMATSLRDTVEGAIKQALSLYPEAGDDSPPEFSDGDKTDVSKQLGHLGFQPNQIKLALTFFSEPTPLGTNLLSQLSSLEAAIEYLVLHLPECDLPHRFLPSSNSSNPFITSSHTGTDNLEKRWIEDRAYKEAGWPLHAVKECTSEPRLVQNWDMLIAALGQKLIGNDWKGILDVPSPVPDAFVIIPDDVESLGGRFEGQSHLVLPLFSCPVELHVLTCKDQYPRPGLTPFYITSPSLPAYVRLFLVSELLKTMQDASLMEDGQDFCMSALQVLESAMQQIEDDGPPDISAVLLHMLPRKERQTFAAHADVEEDSLVTRAQKGPRGQRSSYSTPRDYKQVKQDYTHNPKYTEMQDTRQKLPAFKVKQEFLSMLTSNRVVIVVGETGCGKTTQLPQYVLDALEEGGVNANILVTQPRRLSAIGVATRVASERMEDGSVGYSIRGETKRTRNTKLLFCTTGIVLRRLSAGDGLNGVTHVIVDEVHERSVDGDFLLLQLKDLLKQLPKLKVILMSATINHETFIKYFDGAPLLSIPGFTHPVTDIHLEDIVSKVDYHPRNASKLREKDLEKMKSKYGHLNNQALGILHSVILNPQVDYQFIGALVNYIIKTSTKIGSVLIFLSGVQEIRQCMEAIKSALGPGSRANILPLHANLSNDEQRRVFNRSQDWKIIASTNVAETSITIDDVLFVIDGGKVKETGYDANSGLSSLQECWITRAAGRQRRGRAGRTQSGTCFKLYTKDMEAKMPPFPTPEILRVPLENISLTVKVLREDGDVKDFLRRAISPPDVSALDAAWSILKELGAIDGSEALTALGRYIAMLPVDLRLAKMLVFGCIFKCLNPILTIAAILSSKALFLSPTEKREEAKLARARFLTGNSDVLTDLKAYDECVTLQADGKSQHAIRAFCEENFISASTIRDINTMRTEFLSNLIDISLIPLSSTATTKSLNQNSHQLNLIKGVLVGGLWPRVATVKLPKGAIKFDKVMAGTVQRENVAKEFKIFDLKDGRVFLHPGSVLFGNASWKTNLVVYFNKHQTSKIFLRDATELPYYGLLLFGGPVSVNHVAGGLTVGEGGTMIKFKAWPRIGILLNQLRRLLDAQLMRSINDGTPLTKEADNPVVHAMLSLLVNDGMSN